MAVSTLELGLLLFLSVASLSTADNAPADTECTSQNGTCQSVNQNCVGGYFKKGLCTGAASRRCCVSLPKDDNQCTSSSGTCKRVSGGCPGGVFWKGLCSDRLDRCCIPNAGCDRNTNEFQDLPIRSFDESKLLGTWYQIRNYLSLREDTQMYLKDFTGRVDIFNKFPGFSNILGYQTYTKENDDKCSLFTRGNLTRRSEGVYASGTAQSTFVHVEDTMAVEILCFNPSDDNGCRDFSASIWSRCKDARVGDLERGVQILQDYCYPELDRFVDQTYDPDCNPSSDIAEICAGCDPNENDFRNVPVQENLDESKLEGIWYQRRLYHSMRQNNESYLQSYSGRVDVFSKNPDFPDRFYYKIYAHNNQVCQSKEEGYITRESAGVFVAGNTRSIFTLVTDSVAVEIMCLGITETGCDESRAYVWSRCKDTRASDLEAAEKHIRDLCYPLMDRYIDLTFDPDCSPAIEPAEICSSCDYITIDYRNVPLQENLDEKKLAGTWYQQRAFYSEFETEEVYLAVYSGRLDVFTFDDRYPNLLFYQINVRNQDTCEVFAQGNITRRSAGVYTYRTFISSFPYIGDRVAVEIMCIGVNENGCNSQRAFIWTRCKDAKDEDIEEGMKVIRSVCYPRMERYVNQTFEKDCNPSTEPAAVCDDCDPNKNDFRNVPVQENMDERMLAGTWYQKRVYYSPLETAQNYLQRYSGRLDTFTKDPQYPNILFYQIRAVRNGNCNEISQGNITRKSAGVYTYGNSQSIFAYVGRTMAVEVMCMGVTNTGCNEYRAVLWSRCKTLAAEDMEEGLKVLKSLCYPSMTRYLEQTFELDCNVQSQIPSVCGTDAGPTGGDGDNTDKENEGNNQIEGENNGGNGESQIGDGSNSGNNENQNLGGNPDNGENQNGDGSNSGNNENQNLGGNPDNGENQNAGSNSGNEETEEEGENNENQNTGGNSGNDGNDNEEGNSGNNIEEKEGDENNENTIEDDDVIKGTCDINFAKIKPAVVDESWLTDLYYQVRKYMPFGETIEDDIYDVSAYHRLVDGEQNIYKEYINFRRKTDQFCAETLIRNITMPEPGVMWSNNPRSKLPVKVTAIYATDDFMAGIGCIDPSEKGCKDVHAYFASKCKQARRRDIIKGQEALENLCYPDIRRFIDTKQEMECTPYEMLKCGNKYQENCMKEDEEEACDEACDEDCDEDYDRDYNQDYDKDYEEDYDREENRYHREYDSCY